MQVRFVIQRQINLVKKRKTNKNLNKINYYREIY